MRDIWAVPPGGAAAGAAARRRSRIMLTVAPVVVIGLALGAGVYVAMNRSTAVSSDDALAEFRSQEHADSEATAPGSSRGRHPRRSEAKGVTATSGAAAERGNQPAPVGTSDEVVAVPDSNEGSPAAGGAATPSSRGEGAARPASPIGRPQEGVYTWSIDGYERAPGVERDLPSRSHRVITHEGGAGWTEHHIFSEQREEWFGLVVSRAGVATTSVRNRVEMGPVEVDRTVTYDPPAFVARFPLKVGATWRGSWSGRTSGEYTARTFERTILEIGGEQVEVWATEVVMQMRGEVEGRATTRSWVSPEHRLVVKQEQDMTVESGPGTYRSVWSGQLLSLEPKT